MTPDATIFCRCNCILFPNVGCQDVLEGCAIPTMVEMVAERRDGSKVKRKIVEGQRDTVCLPRSNIMRWG